MADPTAVESVRGDPEAMVEVDHLSFAYPGSPRTILNDVSMTFPRGKITVILGGSGSGKTTLLRVIAGVFPATGGVVRFDGQAVDTRNAERLFAMRRRLGMLFQFGALFTDLSVFDNVAFPLREHTELDEPMVRDIVLMKLNAVGLRGAANLRIGEISGGMARRVALARAIALDPELLLYDEPFTGLDPISLAVAANLIRTLNDVTGATSILVTHDVQESFRICDYAYLMSSKGQVLARGKPDDLMQSEDPQVRQFIRAEPDGPVPFHYPAPSLEEDFGVRA